MLCFTVLQCGILLLFATDITLNIDLVVGQCVGPVFFSFTVNMRKITMDFITTYKPLHVFTHACGCTYCTGQSMGILFFSFYLCSTMTIVDLVQDILCCMLSVFIHRTYLEHFFWYMQCFWLKVV